MRVSMAATPGIAAIRWAIGVRRALEVGEDVAESIRVVVVVARHANRRERAAQTHDGHRAASHHQRDRRHLDPVATELSQQLAIEGAHGSARLPIQVVDGDALACCAARSLMRPLVMRSTRSAIPAMTALCVMIAVAVPTSRFTSMQRLEHQAAGLGVERAGGLVAEENVRPLRDGARDRDALLLAAGELRRKVIEPVAQPDQPQRLLGAHRVRGDLGHQRDVLARRETRDEVVELEDEPDVLAPIAVSARSSASTRS